MISAIGAQERIVYAEKFMQQNQRLAPATDYLCVPCCVPAGKWLIATVARRRRKLPPELTTVAAELIMPAGQSRTSSIPPDMVRSNRPSS